MGLRNLCLLQHSQVIQIQKSEDNLSPESLLQLKTSCRIDVCHSAEVEPRELCLEHVESAFMNGLTPSLQYEPSLGWK